LNWLSSFWFNYEWPSLKGNGPEALTQTVVYGIIIILIVPPIREWFKCEYEKVKHHATKEVATLHARIDDTHAHLDHLIKHLPDVPPMPREAPRYGPSPTAEQPGPTPGGGASVDPSAGTGHL
jgi:hypothetical protein